MASPAPRLRVLVVAGHEPWPLNSGGRLRLHHFLRWLAHDASVTLALPRTPQYAAHAPAGLRITCMRSATMDPSLVGDRPLPQVTRRVQQHFGTDPAVSTWLNAYARPEFFDVVLLYGAVTGQYIDAVRAPVVWDAVDELVLYTVRDAAWRGPRHWPRAARAGVLYAAFERHGARRARATIFASNTDASYARRWVGDARVVTISNGVDCEYFDAPQHPPEPSTVAFIGALSFPPNVEGIVRFTTRIWPRVRAGANAPRLLIVGREPVAAVRALARWPGVEVHADVPDVRPFLARAAVVIVPTNLGGGVKNKVLEACAMRRPVVASPRALAGLNARRGHEVLCAASELAWVRQITRLLADPAAGHAIGEAAGRWVRSAHSWPALADGLRTLLVLASSAARRQGASCTAENVTVATSPAGSSWAARRAPASPMLQVATCSSAGDREIVCT
jgi:glycosyltransferase involved in cell wall biosynthesis